MLFTILVFVLFFCSLSIHELGHAYAMNECGLKIKRISLLGWDWLGTYQLPIKSKHFPDTEWVVHPFIAGAYVTLEKPRALRKLPRADKFYCLGMGPLTNFLFGISLYGFAAILAVLEKSIDAESRFPLEPTPSALLGVTFLTLAVLWLLWRYRRFLCLYALLPLGCVVTGFVIFVIMQAPMLAGWSDFAVMLHDIAPKKIPVSREIINAMMCGGILSSFLGAFNLIPLIPMDGGRLAYELVPVRLKASYAVSTYVIFLCVFFVAPFGKDLYNIVTWSVTHMPH